MDEIKPEHVPKAERGQSSQSKSMEQYSSIEGSFLFHVERFIKLIKFPIGRTAECKHQGSCIASAISASLKSGFYGYLIKLGISLVFKIKSLVRKPKTFLKLLGSKDPLKFSLFAFCFVIIFRGIVCLLRRKWSGEKTKYIFFLAGLISGTLAILNLQKSTRQSVALFMFARALDSLYQTLVQKGYLPQFKYYYVLVYSLMMLVNGGIAYSSEPGVLAPELNKFYYGWTAQTLNEQQMRRIWIERKNNEMALRGIEPYFALDYMPGLRKRLAKKYLK